MKTILVIDDELQFCTLVALALRRAGYEVLVAADGEAGLALARAHPPALVLCDVQMSGLDGYAVLHALRAHAATAAIPVILMTGFAPAAGSRQGMDQGADDFLAKPFDMDQLLATVAARLQRHASIQQAALGSPPASEAPGAAEKLRHDASDQGQVQQMTARGFRNILRVAVLTFLFALIQLFVMQQVCNQGMKMTQSLEHQGLPNLNHLALLREQLILFRLYSYEYLFARENERPAVVAAAQGAAKQVQVELAEVGKLLPAAHRQSLDTALATSFAELAGEFARAQALVDKDFAGAMLLVDREIPLKIQSVDAAQEQLHAFGYGVSGRQAQAAFQSFYSLKSKTVFFGLVNILVALGLVLFVLAAARRTGSQLAQALAQLQAQAQELHLQTSALEAAASAIVITNRAGKIIWANPAFAKLTGYSTAEVVGGNPRLLKSGQHPPQFYAELWRTISAGNIWCGEMINRRKDGSLYDEEMSITPVRGAAGNIQHFIAIKQDVSARKQNELALQIERDLLRSLMDNLPDHIYFKDLSSRFIRINQSHARHLGLAHPTAAVGKSDADFFSMRAARQKLVDERRLLATGEPILGLVEKSETNGIVHWVSSTKVPLRGDDGKISGLVGISHDITQRKQAEESLLESKRFLQATLDALSSHIAILDERGVIVEVNAAWNRFALANQFLGNQHGVGDNYLQVCEAASGSFAAESAAAVAGIRSVMAGQHAEFHLEYPCHSPTEQRWFVVHATRFGGDGLVRVVVAHENITARKHIETQLAQAQKLETVGQLAAGIAHEINTPTQYVGDNTRFVKDSFAAILKVLKGHEELLAAAKQSGVTPELLQRQEALLVESDLEYLCLQIPAAINETLEGVERVSKIVRSMKEFSHPGSKEKAGADLNRAIESTATVASNEWKYVADLKLELAPNLPVVPCFLGEFNQCILNLLVNAAHAIGDVTRQTPGTKGLITVQTRADGDWVEVRVTDTGTGIPVAVRSKIFEPFFTTKDVGKGTGQGLSMIYGSIVKRHGGTATFETEIGRGTSFILRLPLNDKPAALAKLKPNSEELIQ